MSSNEIERVYRWYDLTGPRAAGWVAVGFVASQVLILLTDTIRGWLG